MNNIFKTFIILRFLTLITVQTWFVPDETWQVTEVAHYWTFGYGYLCWEWKESIRSILYPGIFSFIYYILSILRMDFVFLLIHTPRVLSSISFAVGDYYMYKLSSKILSQASSGWVAVCLASSWFLAYCAPRTLSSCAEMTLFALSLYNYPWREEKVSLSTNYLMWGGLGCIIRPTLAVFLAPYCVRHIILSGRKMQLLWRYFFNVFSVLLVSVAVDSTFYGKVTFVPWNFVKFNLLSGFSSHYGTHPWHWYFSQGLPVICGLHLLPAAFGMVRNFRRYSSIVWPTLWGILIHSFLGHKEFRFMIPIIPLVLAIAGDSIFVYLESIPHEEENGRRRTLFVLCLLIVPNVLAFVYMGLIHQRGPTDVMGGLRTMLDTHTNKRPSLLFLTPCHSTPLYSDLHVNIPARFLTCEPNLLNDEHYKDEAELFFEEPMDWIQKEVLNKIEASTLHFPSHLIMYDTLADRLRTFLEENNYRLCRKIFNSHFYDGNRGKYFLIYCHKD